MGGYWGRKVGGYIWKRDLNSILRTLADVVDDLGEMQRNPDTAKWQALAAAMKVNQAIARIQALDDTAKCQVQALAGRVKELENGADDSRQL